MKKLYTARDEMEAHSIRNLLEREGIRATVLGEHLATARGELPLTQDTLPSVWVNDEDCPQALRLLNARDDPAASANEPPPAPWTCGKCGERIEGQFSNCWSCTAPRPECEPETP